MRIQLNITPNTQKVPFNHLPRLVGTLHKWLGENELHGNMSFMSFSWLQRGKKVENGLDFSNGSEWIISSYETGPLKKIISSIQNDPTLFYGMRVQEIGLMQTPDFESEQRFYLHTPILLKTRIPSSEHQKHWLFDEFESSSILTKSLEKQLVKAGINPEGVEVLFDTNDPKARTKLVNYNGVANKASECAVIIKGTPEQLAFAWNVGLGHSTGIGFGTLK